jgi:glycosyltransferase involved in cell wall biosynthesis
VADRVLLLITDLELGGTPTVVRELAIRIRRASAVNVEVACLAKWGPVADQLRDAGVAVTALGARGPADFCRTLPRLIRLIRQRKFGTVFSFLMHANAMASAASLRVGDVRWIQSIQTTQPNPRWHWPIQRLAQRAAETVVVPSASAARMAMEWAGVAEEKIVVIPNAIDLTDWETARSPIPAADPRPYPITFLGRLDPIKDVPTLVRAVRTLNSGKRKGEISTGRHGPALLVHMHIYGEGHDRGRIEETIRQENLGASVTLHGAVDRPQSAMAQSGLLVLPSLAEGFGLVLIEAMAAGVPVVATDVAGIRDVVRAGQTGLLVPAGNAAALAHAIERIIMDQALRHQLTSNASADVRQRFVWDIVLEQYRTLLQV